MDLYKNILRPILFKIVNMSRSIIYSENVKEEARKIQQEMETYLNSVYA